MGLISWKHIRKKDDVSNIVACIVLILLWFMFFYLFVMQLIHDFHWFLLVSVGILLLFLFPFMVIGSFSLIVETISEIRRKKKEQKFAESLKSYLESLDHEEFKEFMQGYLGKKDE